VTVDPVQVFVLGILCASIHWLVARSSIMQPLWSRARGWFDRLLRCPACSGFWIGSGLAVLGLNPVNFTVHHIPSLFPTQALAVFLTPVFEAVLLWGLDQSAIEEREEPPAKN
jgi:hypothetical protein